MERFLPCKCFDGDSAEDFWNLFYLPRCTRDAVAEQAYFEKKHEKIIKFRRVLPDESSRGLPYPLLSALNLNFLSHFGEGIGIYFVQVMTLAVFVSIGAIVLISSMNSYNVQNKDVPYDSSLSFLKISAICKSETVTTSSLLYDASNGGVISVSTNNSTAIYRGSCELIPNVVVCDVVLCWILILCVILSKFVEDNMKSMLDEELISAKDYSIRVINPPEDAIDPDEWFTFFSRFGKVNYVTVGKSNEKVLNLVTQKQRYLGRIEDISTLMMHERGSGHSHVVNPYQTEKRWLFRVISKLPCQHLFLFMFGLNRTNFIQYYKQLIADIDKQLETEYDAKYSASEIFVTFEHTEHKQLALDKFQLQNTNYWMKIVNNLMLYCCGNTPSETKLLFRGKFDIIVKDPPEPDNILWLNGGVSPLELMFRKCFAFSVSVGAFVLIYYIIYFTLQVRSQNLLIAVVSIIDLFAPKVFLMLSVLERHKDEGNLQDAYQAKLYRVRLLTTVVYLYATVSWGAFLTANWVSHFIFYQIIQCFSDHLLKIFNPAPLFQKLFILFDVDPSKSEFRVSNTGTNAFHLAERYTIVSKIFFVSLFYSFMIPVALVIAIFAVFFVFFADQYLLFRKTEQPPMLDGKISVRFREQVILSIAAHMYITCRFVYSWPLDEAYHNPLTNSFEKVNKFPSYNILELEAQPWQSDSQKFYFRLYRNMTVIILIICICLYILGARKIFKANLLAKVKGDSKLNLSVPFSKVSRIFTYFPTILLGSQNYLFNEPENCPVISTELGESDPEMMLMGGDSGGSSGGNYRLEHCYPLVIGRSKKYPNLGELIPKEYRADVLSRVKYYNVVNKPPTLMGRYKQLSSDERVVSYNGATSPRKSRKDNGDSKVILKQVDEEKGKVDAIKAAEELHSERALAMSVELAKKPTQVIRQTEQLTQYLEKFRTDKRGGAEEEGKDERASRKERKNGTNISSKDFKEKYAGQRVSSKVYMAPR